MPCRLLTFCCLFNQPLFISGIYLFNSFNLVTLYKPFYQFVPLCCLSKICFLCSKRIEIIGIKIKTHTLRFRFYYFFSRVTLNLDIFFSNLFYSFLLNINTREAQLIRKFTKKKPTFSLSVS